MPNKQPKAKGRRSSQERRSSTENRRSSAERRASDEQAKLQNSIFLDMSDGVLFKFYPNCNAAVLQELFCRFGNVESVWVPPVEKMETDYAFLRFDNVVSADKAASACNKDDVKWHGQAIKCIRPTKRDGVIPAKNKRNPMRSYWAQIRAPGSRIIPKHCGCIVM